jgi:heavy metal sensor kinase
MLAILGAAALMLLDRGLRDNVDASLLSVARSIAESTRGPSPLGPEFDETLESLLGPGLAERFFRLLDPLGRPDPRIVPRGRVQLPLSPEALHNAEQGRETYQTLHLPGVSSSPVRLLTLPVIERGRIIHFIQVAMLLESAETARSRFLLILLGLAPLALGGAAVGGWFLARRALAPVDTMVETARKIGAEGLSQRITTAESNDELGRLAAVLNDMLARLERSFTAVRHFSADAAHELRTPLTILKGELEVALRSPPDAEEYRRVLASCLEEVDRLSALVEDLLFLARSDSGNVSIPQTPVNLAEVLEEVKPALSMLAETTEISLLVPASPELWVQGNKSMLFRLMFNLGENAIKYTPTGGRVEVSLSRNGHKAVLAVHDTGPGIAPEEQERIFDRFYRGDPARSRGGSGLGLALVRSIVLLHGGSISVESTVGKGSCFHVTLPLVHPSDRV